MVVRKPHNLIVCFPGGTGGHFVLSVCVNLLYPSNHGVNPNNDGSMHGAVRGGYEQKNKMLLFQYSGNLDKEIELIDNLPNFDYTCSHLQNIQQLVKRNKKVVYITFDQDDKHQIYEHLRHKASHSEYIKSFNEERYNFIKGSSWPSYEEFKSGNVHPELLGSIDDPEHSARPFLDEWKYILPDSTENTCEIKFKEVMDGNTMLEKLVDFLKVDQYNVNRINKLIENYRNKNKELYQ